MFQCRFVLAAGAFGILAVSHAARADRTFLVGGTVLEGKATRKGSKVVVEVEAGEVSLPADTVTRIEKSESTVSRFEARRAGLHAGDVKARLDLADYCRDHDMRARERGLLFEILEIDGNNTAARARLGYVKTDAGWVTQADAMRARGLVLRDGQWMTPSELRDLDRVHAEAELLARHRDEEEAELATRRAQLAAQQADLDAQRSHVAAAVYAPYYGTYFTPVYGPTLRGGFEDYDARRGARPRVAPHPFDATSLSVVKVPYRHP